MSENGYPSEHAYEHGYAVHNFDEAGVSLWRYCDERYTVPAQGHNGHVWESRYLGLRVCPVEQVRDAAQAMKESTTQSNAPQGA